MKELLLKWLELQLSRPPQTVDELEAHTRAFVVRVVTLILFFIVVSLIYSVTFVSQPIKAMAPIDQAYTKMLNDIVLLIVGGIGGILTKGVTTEARAMMDSVKQGKDAYTPPPPPPVQNITVSPANWTPPPPPSSPPRLEDDEERLRMATARESTRV